MWMTIAVPLLANLYDPSNAEKLRVLVMMLQKLETFTLWVALEGVGWGVIKCVLVTGKATISISTRGAHAQVSHIVYVMPSLSVKAVNL